MDSNISFDNTSLSANTGIVTRDDTEVMFGSSEQIEEGLVFADKFINRNYLMGLSKCAVVPLQADPRIYNGLRLYRVHKIVFSETENINDKLISVYGSLHDLQTSALLVIDSDGTEVHFYVGVFSVRNAATAGLILEKGFKGNFPGSRITGLDKTQIESVMADITTSLSLSNTKTVTSVSIIPSMRDEDKEKFVQGIEKFIDTMRGSAYTAMILAEPVSKETLEIRKRGLEELYSTISPFSKTSIAFGKSDSYAVSKGNFSNFSEAISRSVSNSTTFTSGESRSETDGTNRGHSFGLGGFGLNRGKSQSSTKGYSSSNSWAKAVTEGDTTTTGGGTSDTDTRTTGDSRTLTLNHENKAILDLMEQIEAHLERIRESEVFGFWECAAYFISDDIQTSVIAANSYKALMAGNQSSVENSFVNIWEYSNNNTPSMLEYLRHGMQPCIMVPSTVTKEPEIVTPSAMVSGSELPIVLGLPRHSVPGVTVMPMAEFGRNVFLDKEASQDRLIRLGNIYHMGETEETEVNLNLDSLTAHCFITGSTGSGKSNTSYQILSELIRNDIRFLVIEPAKGEYKKDFGALPGVNVFCTNPNYYSMLKLNPFRFDDRIHILEHLDRIIEIFNACWPMYAAMPAILKSAIEQAYERCGWDLDSSMYYPNNRSKFPDFSDVLDILPEVINSSSYSADSKGDYTGALVTRVKSLTTGITGRVFCSGSDIPDNILFDENTIVDLSRVGSTETKSLIMGILILKINEYRSLSTEENRPLQHVTVLEEAHNILKRTSTDQSQDGANLLGKSVEMICNSIAEMRTYGEGFILIDQSPSSVDIAAIKNTNTKIIMNLPEKEDCLMVGAALSLDEKQIAEIPKLGTGKAIVRQSNWTEAVLTAVTYYKKQYKKDLSVADQKAVAKLKGAVLEEVYAQYVAKAMDYNRILDIIGRSEINSFKKKEIVIALKKILQADPSEITKRDFAAFVVNFAGCAGLCKALPVPFKGIKLEQGVSPKIRQEIQSWFSTFYKALNNYFVITNNRVKTALAQYILLHAMREFSEDDRYIVIYETIFMD